MPSRAAAFASALLLAVAAPAAAAPDFSPLLNHPALDERFNGTIRITRGEEVLLELSRGSDRAGRPASQETAYWLGSISKHFAAAALLSLLEETGIPLDRPVASLIQEWPAAALRRDGVDCTLELLLSHQCGLPRDASKPDDDLHRDPEAESAFLSRLNGSRLEFTPGTAYQYSNAGFDLAGVLVSRLARAPYHEVVARRLFAPLALKVTGVEPGRVSDLAQRIAPGHFPLPWASLSSEAWLDIPWDAPSRVGASGNAYSTAPELTRWFRALLRGEVLSERSLASMLTPRRDDYGFGLVTEKRPEGRLVWHNGALSPHGHNAFVGHLRETDTTVVVLSNEGRTRVSATTLGLGLMDLVHGRKPGPLFESALSKRMVGGLPGFVFLGLPLAGLLWCVALVVRAGRDGMFAWTLQVQTALFLVLATEAMLGTFRPSRMQVMLPVVLAAQAVLLAIGLRRFRAVPLIAQGRRRAVMLNGATLVGVTAVLATRLGAVLPAIGLGAVSGAALLLLAHLWRARESTGDAPRRSDAA